MTIEEIIAQLMSIHQSLQKQRYVKNSVEHTLHRQLININERLNNLNLQNSSLKGLLKYCCHINLARCFTIINDKDRCNIHMTAAKNYKETLKKIGLLGLNNIADHYNVAFENLIDVELHLDLLHKTQENSILFARWQKFKTLAEKINNVAMLEHINYFDELLLLENEFLAQKKVFLEYDSNAYDRLFIAQMTILCNRITEKCYLDKVNFMLLLCSVDHPERYIFNECFTNEQIKCKARIILRDYFHPDHAQWVKQSEHTLLKEVCTIIINCKNKLLVNTNMTDKEMEAADYYSKHGDMHWEKSVNYQYAIENKYAQLTILNVNDVYGLSVEKLEELSVVELKLAYDWYYSACKEADKSGQNNLSIESRRKMAFCLYLLKDALLAQMCAIANIFIILNTKNDNLSENLMQAIDLWQKINNVEIVNNNSNTFIKKLELLQDNEYKKSLIMNREYSIQDENKLLHAIKLDMINLSLSLMLAGNHNVVKYNSPNEKITSAKDNALAYKLYGCASAIAGSGLAIFVSTSTLSEVIASVGFLAGGVISGSGIALTSVFGSVGLGFLAGYKLWNKGNELYNEPLTREKLNEIISGAFKLYSQRKYDECYELLMTEYAAGKKLFEYKNAANVVDGKKMITELLQHEFRPDGIAFLLNMIAEVLYSGKVKLVNIKRSHVIGTVVQLLTNILDQQLQDTAVKYDQLIKILRLKSINVYVHKFIDFTKLKGDTELASEHIYDAQEMPFRYRLEEIRNVAKLNLAIINLADLDQQGFDEAKKMLIEVRKSINNNFQFVRNINNRLNIIEECFWIISQNNIQSKKVLMLENTSGSEVERANTSTSDKIECLAELQQQLRCAKTSLDKLIIHLKLGKFYENLVMYNYDVEDVDILSTWQDALYQYQQAIKIDDKSTDTLLGYARCLLVQGRYKELIYFYDKYKSYLSSHANFWMLNAIAQYKKTNYSLALNTITQALNENEVMVADAEKLRNLVIKSQTKSGRTWHAEIKHIKYVDADEHNYARKHIEQYNGYHILSIDGGGIRGILPAMWLSEIEKRSHKPIAHLFNMTAGTSTGAIIVASLSTPARYVVDVHDSQYSNFYPRHTASDILSLYIDSADKIFTKNFARKIPLYNLKKTKYSSDGRYTLFNQYFGTTRLQECLTEVVIPAVNLHRHASTYIFSKMAAKQNSNYNYSLVDACMASSAAPTYFETYGLDNGVFCDGGVQMNNPSLRAYHESLSLAKDKDKIRVLSMGTGCCVPDPLNPDTSNDLLFWAKNIHTVAMSAQESNPHHDLKQCLADRYQRWQINLGEPISLDAYDKANIDMLLELGKQFIEEQYAAEDNAFNKLLESLTDNAEHRSICTL